MVEAALDQMMMGAAAAAPEENLLINTGGGGDNLLVPAALDANDDYEETQMNPNGFFSEDSDQACSVKVAVRIRPLVGRELRDGNRRECVEAQPELNKLQIDTSSFTFDRVFHQEAYQDDIFEVCSRNLILGCFNGYNATILAYGQTGSGKTHTMGTGSTVGLPAEQIGIVPRVFDFIFHEIENRRKQSEFSEFTVKIQFLELYGDDIRDLLDSGAVDKVTGQKAVKDIRITEDKKGSISVAGLKSEIVSRKEECIQLLNKGIAHRMTSSTLMNEQSSRSHAIFTVTIEQKIVKVTQPADGEAGPDAEPVTSEENISAKFHFVDLAGSERIKKTGAIGQTLKEGIQINQGLLALGNVIAALTDEKKISAGKQFIPYRNSKLTRILQDSLGGNSRTTMIACVSPAESNYEETLSSIKYASRARNIKNKPIVNRDANSMLIEALRNQITQLQTEITEYQGLLKSNNIPIPNGLQEVIEQKAQETQAQRRSSILNMTGLQNNLGGGGGQGSADISNSELREIKLKLARAQQENKALREELEQLKKTGAAKASNADELQNERDSLVMKIEALNELVAKNNIAVPSNITQAPTSGGKRTQTLIDEYKNKAAKAREEVEKKTAELLVKSKKITELQSAMKRDEGLLKKQIEEVSRLKKQLQNQKTQERLIVQPVAMPGVKSARGNAKASGDQRVPDAEEIQNKFMDKLTSQLENYFAADDEGEGEGAQPAIAVSQPDEEEKQEVGAQDEPSGAAEGDQFAKRSIEEANRAHSLEEKEKLLSAVKQNVDQIKADLGELLKNTWAQRIHEIQTQMGRMEQDKRGKLANSQGDQQSKAIEKEYKQKMEALQQQLNDQQRQKKKKEDTVQKALMQSESRLSAMEKQLASMKKERDEAEQAKKYGEERFSKFKSNVNKDLLTYKKTVKDKDQAVFKLKNDLKKTDQLVSQKINELKTLQKKAREEAERRKKEEEMDNDAKGIDIDAIKDWIHQSTDQMLKQQELNEYLKKQIAQRDEIEDDMLKEGDRLTDLIVQKERLEYEMEENTNAEENGGTFDEARQLEIEGELEDVVLESDSITATLDVLEEHLDHVETKIASIESEIKAFNMESVQPPRFKGLNNVDNARATLKTFFSVLLDLNVYKKDLENKMIEQAEQMIELQSKVSILQEASSMTNAQQQVALRKKQAMENLVGQLGSGTDFIDSRETDNMNLSNAESTQLTKMSLSKIVTNLRNKLREEEKRNQSTSNKLDQILKEKEQIKTKYQQLQKEIKKSGVVISGDTRGSFSVSPFQPMEKRKSQTAGTDLQVPTKSLGAIKSRINTGLDGPHSARESGRESGRDSARGSQSARAFDRLVQQAPLRKKMSFKERRDSFKEQNPRDGAKSARQAAQVSSLSKPQGRSGGISNLQETRASSARQPDREKNKQLTEEIELLERDVKVSLANSSNENRSSAKKRQFLTGAQQPSAITQPKAEPDEQYLTAASQPDTVIEEPDLEGSDQDEPLVVEESDEMLDAALREREKRLSQLDDNQEESKLSMDDQEQSRFGAVSFLGESILENEGVSQYQWAFEDVASVLVDDPTVTIVNFDCINERCFILFSNLKLSEVNLETKAVVQEIALKTVEGAAEHVKDNKAVSFAMYKDLNTIAISTENGYHMFDYESELKHLKSVPLSNVNQICFIDEYIIVVTEDDESDDAILSCYEMFSDELQGQIKIKQFLGKKVQVRPAESSICFAAGSQIGRIQVPEMELHYQEDAGHQIIDFATNDIGIFTTGEDSSLRLFDVESGMMLIEPMQEMEVDRLVVQGMHIVARCGGGQAMMVFKYQDGNEELEEEDFIECENMFGDDEESQENFLMKGGLKAELSGTLYNMILTCYQSLEDQTVSVKMLKNKSYAAE